MTYETCIDSKLNEIVLKYPIAKTESPRGIEYISGERKDALSDAKLQCDIEFPEIIAEKPDILKFLEQGKQHAYHVPLRYFLNDHVYIEGYATMRGPGNQSYPGKVYFILSGGNILNPYTHVLPTMTSREDNNDFWQSISDITKIARPRK